MSIKGFPSQQKLVQGQASKADFATVQPSSDYKNALDTVARSAFRVGSATIPRVAGALTGNANDGYGTIIDDAATVAQVGDFVRFIDGNCAFKEMSISEINGNLIRLAVRVPTGLEPVPGDSFYVMRYATGQVDDQGNIQVTTTPGPIEFVLDSVNTQVSQDTVVPANSIPLPVINLNPNGTEVDPATETTLAAMSAKLPATLGQKASALSLATVLSTEQEALIGDLTETAPATDTASSGLNGRLQRIAQNISSLILQLPVTIGQKLMAGSLSVTMASDQTAIPVSSAGKTHNTSAMVDYSLVNILSASWTLLLTMPATPGTAIMIFESGGYTIELGIGNAGSETRVLLIPPGGFNGPVPLALPAGSKISLRGVEVPVVNSGQFVFTILS